MSTTTCGFVPQMNFISKVGTRRLKNCLGLGILFTLLLPFMVFVRKKSRFIKYQLPPAAKPEPGDHVGNFLNLSSRTDVTTSTDWGAPILWDGMFDPDTYDKYHQKMGTSVALTVFAVGKYLEAYLMDLLSSAELHFMEGLPVTYYVFTDAPENVPGLQLKTGRALEIIKVKRHKRWEDISMMRMETLADAVQTRIRHGHRYVFCLDVDMVFAGRFGSEALGESVALQHSSFYNTPKVRYTYDRNPNSTACMETGDLYYHAAVFGGTWESVANLTESCHRDIMTDKRKGVEALWHDESHLNKYFWLNKPSRVLSPEYGWNPLNGPSREIHVKRLLWAEKHYSRLRT